MENQKPTYSVRIVQTLIEGCHSQQEIERVKDLIIEDIHFYTPKDQGFIMAMVGLMMLKFSDPMIIPDTVYKK